MQVRFFKKKQKTIILFIIVAVSSAALAVYLIFSKSIFHRSNLASFSELLFRVSNIKEVYSDVDKFDKYVKLKQKENRMLSYIPEDFINKKLNINSFGELKVIDIDPDGSNNSIIIYIHGGTYISEISLYHLKYCEKLSKQLDINVLLPLYPLAPEYNYNDAYPLLYEFYSEQLKRNKKIIFIGDSAGGGLAAGFCEYLFELDVDTPEKLVLFSPWLDVSMTNEYIPFYEKYDPLLSSPGLISAGKLWAGEESTKNYKVSPIYGNLSAFSDVTLFVGTREIFYPDVTKFYEMLKKAGVETELNIGMGLNHIYTTYPIPEATDAFELVCNKIGQ